MAFQNLCAPALIYLMFSITQVVIDSVKGLYNTALVKIWVAFIFTILLNYLCQLGLGIISWIIVFIPFILMTLIVAILLLMFGLDPTTGKLKIMDDGNDKNHTHHKHSKKYNKNHHHHPPPAYDDKPFHGNKSGPSDFKPEENTKDNIMNDRHSKDTSIEKDTNEGESNEKKTNRILSRSLLFYTETDEGDDSESGSSFKKNVEKLDTRKFIIFLNSITDMLSSMGESEIASDLQTKAMACVNSANKMNRDEAIKSIESCFEELMRDLMNEVDVETQGKIIKNMTELHCPQPMGIRDCQKKIKESLWN